MSKEICLSIAVILAFLAIIIIFTNAGTFGKSIPICMGKKCEIHLTGEIFKIEMDCPDEGYKINAVIEDKSVVEIIGNGTMPSKLELFGISPKCYFELRGKKIGNSDVIFSYCKEGDCSQPAKTEVFSVLSQ